MSDKSENTPDKIREGLRAIRIMRTASHFPILLLFIFGLAQAFIFSESWKEYSLPLFKLIFLFAAIGFVLGFGVRFMDCPRCGNKFHHKKTGETIIKWYMYNEFARACLHCGLKLNGSNISK